MSTNESENNVTETINDFETALDIWEKVGDANDEKWIRGEDGHVYRWFYGAFQSRPDAAHRPTPPFTNAAIKRATA